MSFALQGLISFILILGGQHYFGDTGLKVGPVSTNLQFLKSHSQGKCKFKPTGKF
jgi:hypothetical protein